MRVLQSNFQAEVGDSARAIIDLSPSVISVAAVFAIILGTVWTPVTIAMLIIYAVVFFLDMLIDIVIASAEWLRARKMLPNYGRRETDITDQTSMLSRIAGGLFSKVLLSLTIPLMMAADGLIVLGLPVEDGALVDIIRLGLLTKATVAGLTLVLIVLGLQKIDGYTDGRFPIVSAMLRQITRLHDRVLPGGDRRRKDER